MIVGKGAFHLRMRHTIWFGPLSLYQEEQGLLNTTHATALSSICSWGILLSSKRVEVVYFHSPFQIFSENRFPNYLLSLSSFSSSRWQSLGRFQRKHAAARKTCLSTRAYTHIQSSTRTSTILCLMDLVTARKERERGGQQLR